MFHAWGDGETDATLIVSRKWHRDEYPDEWKGEADSFADYFNSSAMLIIHEDGLISFMPDQFPAQFDRKSEEWVHRFLPELLWSLYSIAGLPLSKASGSSSYVLPISAFANDGKLEKMRQAFTRYLQQLKEYQDSLPPRPMVPSAVEI